MTECDLCGEDKPYEEVEVLGFDRGHAASIGDDFWRVANVCRDCRDDDLYPALRQVFGDGALSLNPADGDGWETISPSDEDAVFFTYVTDRETTHIAKRVERAVAMRDEHRCVGYCGIEARAEPEPRQSPVSARAEGILVCGRCARHAPDAYFAGGDPP